ncbi:MAG: DNA-3-methyladenine glycosylase [Deltaproteobacteria bacterium]|nr:DNA-3-methyladenine glycosylase [Deltaproteobacteria bacterium]
MRSTSFTSAFFGQPTLRVAPKLLGAILSTSVRGKVTSGRIVEVEAYCGPSDPAAHSAKGRTERTEVMFWAGGHCYVYFVYGAHFCVNVVTGREGSGEAILIRALEPMEGIETMRRRRGNVPDSCLANGPGKLCQALAIDRRMYGEHFLGSHLIGLSPGCAVPAKSVGRSERIGITLAQDKQWRFYVKGSPCLSRPERRQQKPLPRRSTIL